jgi:hypothetical protein
VQPFLDWIHSPPTLCPSSAAGYPRHQAPNRAPPMTLTASTSPLVDLTVGSNTTSIAPFPRPIASSTTTRPPSHRKVGGEEETHLHLQSRAEDGGGGIYVRRQAAADECEDGAPPAITPLLCIREGAPRGELQLCSARRHASEGGEGQRGGERESRRGGRSGGACRSGPMREAGSGRPFLASPTVGGRDAAVRHKKEGGEQGRWRQGTEGDRALLHMEENGWCREMEVIASRGEGGR